MQYLSNLKVPYININTYDAGQANKEIEMLYLDSAKTFDACADEANSSSITSSCSQILTYRTYKYNDILSVVVISGGQSTAPWVLEYNIYNFDLTTGNLLDYDSLLTKTGYDKNETLAKMKNLLKNKMDELWGKHADMSNACGYDGLYFDYTGTSCYEKANEILEDSIEDDSVLFFVNNEGNLNILTIPFYSGVQNGEMNKYLFEVAK